MKLVRFNQPMTLTDFVEDFFDMGFGQKLNRQLTVPAVNISTGEKEYKIDLAVPGMNKDEFDIDVENNILTISTQKSEENKEETDNFTCREFCYSSFSRSFNLSEDIDQEKINASYENGILSIILPKKDIAITKGNKKVKIS